jgi:hypothetical protein
MTISAICTRTGAAIAAGFLIVCGSLFLSSDIAIGQDSDSVHESECIVDLDGGAGVIIPTNACTQAISITYCIASAGDDTTCQSPAAFQSVQLAAKARSKLRVSPEQTLYITSCLAPRMASATTNAGGRLILKCAGDGPVYASSANIGPAPKAAPAKAVKPSKSAAADLDMGDGAVDEEGLPKGKPAQYSKAQAADTPAPAPPAPAPAKSASIAELNAQQAAAAGAKERADAEAAAAYKKKLAEVEAENARRQAEYAQQQAEYKAAVAAREAETARINAANAAAQAKYQKDLADYEACKKGDKARCK